MPFAPEQPYPSTGRDAAVEPASLQRFEEEGGEWSGHEFARVINPARTAVVVNAASLRTGRRPTIARK